MSRLLKLSLLLLSLGLFSSVYYGYQLFLKNALIEGAQRTLESRYQRSQKALKKSQQELKQTKKSLKRSQEKLAKLEAKQPKGVRKLANKAAKIPLIGTLPAIGLFAADAVNRLPHTLFFALPAIEGQSLIMALDRAGFAVASGSACGSHHDAPSHVLQAMGIDEGLARGAVRLSLGVGSSRQGIDKLLTALEQQSGGLTSMAAVGW